MAVNGVMNAVMRNKAIGCMVIVSGKVRGQRARTQKYVTGYLISTGQPKKELIDTAIRHVLMRQGVLGLKVSIMADVKKTKGDQVFLMPDFIQIRDPKDDRVEGGPRVMSHSAPQGGPPAGGPIGM